MDKGNMNTPLLTVIVPIYNGERNLKETIESIRRSQYSNIEILLLNDGSSDGSTDICRKYVQQDKRIRFCSDTNHGIVYTRNKGIQEARGEYICLCDQDDIVDAAMYGRILQKMILEDAQIGICSTGRLINGQKVRYETVIDSVYRDNEILTELLYPILFRGYRYDFVSHKNYIYGTIWKCIFKKQFVTANNICFRRYVDYEDDWLFLTQALCCASIVATVSNIGYYWKVNENSSSHKNEYIENLPQKFKLLDKDCQKYMSARIMNSKVLKCFRQVQLCDHYIECIQYYKKIKALPLQERSMYKKKYKKEVREYFISTDYSTQMSCLQQLTKSSIRRKAVGWALMKFGINTAFIVSGIVNILEDILMKNKYISNMERLLKK